GGRQAEHQPRSPFDQLQSTGVAEPGDSGHRGRLRHQRYVQGRTAGQRGEQPGREQSVPDAPRHDHPAPGSSTAAASATGAVSARRTRGPNVTASAPAATRVSTSAPVRPPSGPVTTLTASAPCQRAAVVRPANDVVDGGCRTRIRPSSDSSRSGTGGVTVGTTPLPLGRAASCATRRRRSSRTADSSRASQLVLTNSLNSLTPISVAG